MPDRTPPPELLSLAHDAAARGGGFWSRIRRNAKWFVIGAAAGGLAAAAAR